MHREQKKPLTIEELDQLIVEICREQYPQCVNDRKKFEALAFQLKNLLVENARTVDAATKAAALDAAFDAAFIKMAGASAATGDQVAKLAAEVREAIAALPIVEGFETQKWTEIDDSPRQWLIPGIIPCARFCGIYGKGGDGKSLLALMIAQAVMHGGPVLRPDPVFFRGIPDADSLVASLGGLCAHLPGSKRVLWFSWEDEQFEVKARWRRLHAAGAFDFSDVPGDNLFTFVDARRLGTGPLWAVEDGGHIACRATWTESGQRFLSMLDGYDLIILDPLAAIFSGNENDRSQVREFTAALDAAGEKSDAAILMVGHTPKNAAEYSGSTDWQASVRAMLNLEVATVPGRDPDDKGRLAYRVRASKSSYGKGRTVWLRRHFEIDADGTEQMGWFATDPEAAAESYGSNLDDMSMPWDSPATAENGRDYPDVKGRPDAVKPARKSASESRNPDEELV